MDETPHNAESRTRRALLIVAALAVALVFACYGFAVFTRWGQRVDAAALRGRRALSTDDLEVVDRLHGALDLGFVVVAMAITAVAILRGRARLAIGVGVIVVGSVGTAEGLKRTLGRPHLHVADVLRHGPSYPSGHAAAAIALAVCAAFVAPKRWRIRVAMVGALFASVVAWSLVATVSHRPSDAIGSAFIVTAWSALVAILLVGAGCYGPAIELRASRWVAIIGIALALGAIAILAVTVIAIRFTHEGAGEFGAPFLASGGSIAGAVLICVSALLLALRGQDLGPQRIAPGRTDDYLQPE